MSRISSCLHFCHVLAIMVTNVYGKVSLRAFIGGVGVLALFLPSIVNPAYRHFVVAWWIYILSIYVLLAVVLTGAAYKNYAFKVHSCHLFES